MRTILTGKSEHCNIILFITKHKPEKYDNINNYIVARIYSSYYVYWKRKYDLGMAASG